MIGTIPGHIHMFSGWHRWSVIGTIPGHIHMFGQEWVPIADQRCNPEVCDWDHSWYIQCFLDGRIGPNHRLIIATQKTCEFDHNSDVPPRKH